MSDQPSDREVFDWIKDHYGNYMSRRLLEIHRRVLIDQDYDTTGYGGMLPADLDKVLQTVRHARACIRAEHEPLLGLIGHQHTID